MLSSHPQRGDHPCISVLVLARALLGNEFLGLPDGTRDNASRGVMDPLVILTGLKRGPAGDKAGLWH